MTDEMKETEHSIIEKIVKAAVKMDEAQREKLYLMTNGYLLLKGDEKNDGGEDN